MGSQVKFLLKLFSKSLQGVGRSLPVANALRRPNRQVRPEPYGLALDLKWALAREKRGKQGSWSPVGTVQDRPRRQPRNAPPFPDGGAVSLSVTATPCQLPQGGSRVSSPPEVCRKPSLASPFGGRWCPVGTVQRLVSAAASVGDGRSPLGCITRVGRREGGGPPRS